MIRSIVIAAAALVPVLVGCERKSAPPDDAENAVGSPTAQPDARKSSADQPATGHHAGAIELGTAQIGDFVVRAARDQGEIRPGGDAPIDVWVQSADGEPARVVAVRFWIGTQDAKGSVKAKADIEDPAVPHHWHTHADLPDPLPAGSRLWVELEIEGSEKVDGSFDLKP